MTLARALQVAAGNSQESADVAEAIDFDGTNDTLYRSSLTGAADGKTFTFSAFVWIDTTGSRQIINIQGGSINIFVSGSNTLSMQLSSTSGGTRSITLYTTSLQISLNTWVHILYSADVTSTVTRRLYINDVLVSPTYTDYNNINIDWTAVDVYVGGDSAKWDGRLSNVYLDYTYRDLTDTANRRLFVTADLKPAAGQAALNPILYLPMSDPTAPGVNAGTGGNFTLTGTVARSGRGPNQYNAPYSDFDGTADYLNRTSITGLADGSSFTVSFSYSPTVQTTDRIIIGNDSQYFNVWFNAGLLRVQGKTSAGATLLLALVTAPTLVVGRNYTITISIDLSSASNRAIYINGESATVTWSTYTNGSIDFTRAFGVGANNSAGDKIQGKLGALWFNTSYIDLSVPANLAKFVTGTGIDAKPVDLGANGELPTGTSPLIYLPMYGNRAGKNYGTGGDFTVNSGPYTGARGPNEFWSGSGLFNNPTQSELSALSLNNSPDVTGITKTTFALCFKRRDVDVTDTSVIFNTTSSTNNNYMFSVYFDDLERLNVGWNGHTVATSSAITDTNWHTLLVSVDSTATVARVYLDNVSLTSTITLNRTYTQAFTYVGRQSGVNAFNCFDGNIGFVYQAHDYIDISQEANRLKFFDAFGYPVNLTQQIKDGAIPAAYIYLLFPESNLGTNNGTAGNFTNASVTASALVKA